MMKKTLLSLFDSTGKWSEPYRKAGWDVIQQDIKHGQCIFDYTLPGCINDSQDGGVIHGLLAAVPCTEFAVSGARWWPEKWNKPANYQGRNIQFDNAVEEAIFMVMSVLFIIELFESSLKFWAIENPVGRIHKLVPELGKPKMYFQPTDFGHPYTKRTALYGNFNTNLRKNYTLNLFGSEMWSKYGGKSEKTKAARSVTPSGFAEAFFKANH